MHGTMNINVPTYLPTYVVYVMFFS